MDLKHKTVSRIPTETDLVRAGATLNSPRKWPKCHLSRPCKRVQVCDGCRSRRRQYFIEMGSRIVLQKRLTTLLTLAWTNSECPWSVLLGRAIKAISIVRKNGGKQIRVMAIGTQRTPHLHVLLAPHNCELSCKRIRSLPAPERPTIQYKGIAEPKGLLGYIFDQNYMPTLSLTDRPRRIRLLTGCRGMSYGYPPRHEWERYLNLLSPLTGEEL